MARNNPPESMQHHLRQRLNAYTREHWPQLSEVRIRYRAGFAYLDGLLPDGNVQPLCRLRFTGILHTWGFALHLASRDGYRGNLLPSGLPSTFRTAGLQPRRSPRLRLRPLPQHPRHLAQTPRQTRRRTSLPR